MHFKIVGSDDKPIIPYPIVIINNKKGNTIYGFSADSLGDIPEIFIFGPFAGLFKFTSLANKELIIKADTLKGYKSKVKVILPKRINYRDYGGEKKYLIKKQTKTRIVLQNIKTGEKVVLKRED